MMTHVQDRRTVENFVTNNCRATRPPKITVITGVFNRENTLQAAIDSIRAQTGHDIEYIVIDGGSTDGTLGVIRANEDFISYWVSEPDAGIYDAMNKGIERASGDIVGILNSDDLYAPNAFDCVVDAWCNATDPDNAVVYGDMTKYIDGTDPREGMYVTGDLSAQSMQAMTLRMTHPTCFVARSLYTRFGGFDKSITLGADRDLFLRLRRHGAVFHKLDNVIAYFRMGGATSRRSLNALGPLITQEWIMMSRHGVSRGVRVRCVSTFALRMMRDLFLSQFLSDEVRDTRLVNRWKARSSQ